MGSYNSLSDVPWHVRYTKCFEAESRLEWYIIQLSDVFRLRALQSSRMHPFNCYLQSAISKTYSWGCWNSCTSHLHPFKGDILDSVNIEPWRDFRINCLFVLYCIVFFDHSRSLLWISNKPVRLTETADKNYWQHNVYIRSSNTVSNMLTYWWVHHTTYRESIMRQALNRDEQCVWIEVSQDIPWK